MYILPQKYRENHSTFPVFFCRKLTQWRCSYRNELPAQQLHPDLPPGNTKNHHAHRKYLREKPGADFGSTAMTRGRHPVRAIDNAKEIAEKRGLVRHYARTPGRLCDFSIVSPHGLAEVRMKPMRHIRCTPEWLEREAGEEIAVLKMYPSSQQISRELWISSPAYFRRYFRVCDTGLIELSPDGLPLPANSPKTGPARRRTAGTPAPAPDAPGSPASPGSPGPESPAPSPSPAPPDPASPAGGSPVPVPPGEGTPAGGSVKT